MTAMAKTPNARDLERNARDLFLSIWSKTALIVCAVGELGEAEKAGVCSAREKRLVRGIIGVLCRQAHDDIAEIEDRLARRPAETKQEADE